MNIHESFAERNGGGNYQEPPKKIGKSLEGWISFVETVKKFGEDVAIKLCREA